MNKGYRYIISFVLIAALFTGFYAMRERINFSIDVMPDAPSEHPQLEGVEMESAPITVGNGESPQNESAQPDMINPVVTLKTNKGDIDVELFADDAPLTVENFLKLSRQGFYHRTKFHRVIKGFMIQGGDPNSKDDDWSDDGFGGPGYTFKDEINQRKLARGVLAMANSGPNTNGSQFFILTAEEAPWLDGKHTVFGKVVRGMDIVKAIESAPTNERDHPTEDMNIMEVMVK